MKYEEFKNDLSRATTEEVVKATYAKYFKIKYNTSNKHDLYNAKVFFEFKWAKALRKLRHPSRSEKLRSFLEGDEG